MPIGTSANAGAIKRFTKQGTQTLYVKECDKDGTPLTGGDGTIWTCLGISKGTGIDVQTDSYTEMDDTGADVVNEETVKTYEVTTTLLQRDTNTRQLFDNTIGKFYQLAVQGQLDAAGTQVEAHAFAVCKISPKYSYKIGEKGQFEGVKISTIKNNATISVTLPTAIGTGTLTIGIGEMWATGNI